MIQKSDQKSQLKTNFEMVQVGKRSFLIGFFLVFPIFLAFFGNRLLFLEIEDRLKTETENRLEEAISKIESEKDPIEYFSRFFRKVEKRVFSGPNSLSDWKEIAGFLKRRYGESIHLVFLDGQGKQIPDVSDRPISRTLAKKFYESYKIFLREKKPLTPTAQSFVKSFLGNLVPVDREFHSIFFYGAPPPRNEFIYVSRPNDRGMFMVFFQPPRPLSEIALKEQIGRFQRKNPLIRLCYVSRGEKSREVLKRLGLQGSIKGEFWKHLQKSTTGKAWFNNILLSRRILFPSSWVIGSISLSSHQTFFPSGISGTSSMAFFLFAFLVIIAGHVFPIEHLVVSVRYKLLFAFLYAALVPLLIMRMTASSFLAERQTVLEDETHQKVEKTVMAFDELFLNHWLNLKEEVRQHQFRTDYSAMDAYQDFLTRFEIHRKRYFFDLCRIFDSSGKEVFEFIDPGFSSAFGGHLKVLPKLAQGLFSQLLSEEKDSKGGGEGTKSQSLPKMDPLLAMGNFSFGAWLSDEFRLGDTQLFLLSLPLGSGDNRFTHIAYLIIAKKRMEWTYVRENLNSISRQQGLGDFFAWSPESPEFAFPLPFSHAKAVRPFFEKVVSPSVSFREKIREGNQTLLLTGLRGTRLNHFSFLCVTPDLEIQAVIYDLSWKFRFITLAIIGISIAIGFLLSRLIIDPLGNLHRGMEAITNRDFEFVIPVAEPDELGALAHLFNNTFKDLQDLDLARVLQENLFPKTPLLMGTWEIYGSCFPSSQVGGDYFDYFPIDDQRIILIIGDVSGHGVGAALVVAMVKAIIGHPATTGKPLDILASLNTILFSILKRKKIMSCCIGLLDQSTGILSLTNAGQTYPVFLTAGKPSFLELTGYPLGSVKNWQATTRSFPLQARDIVLFYTDGLIEALDQKGEPIGYDRFLEALPSLIRENAVLTEQAIRSWHMSLTRSGRPDDDISLLVMMGNQGSGAPS